MLSSGRRASASVLLSATSSVGELPNAKTHPGHNSACAALVCLAPGYTVSVLGPSSHNATTWFGAKLAGLLAPTPGDRVVPGNSQLVLASQLP